MKRKNDNVLWQLIGIMRKNDNVSRQLIRTILGYLGAAILCGVVIVIGLQSNPLLNRQHELSRFIAMSGLIVFLLAIGAAFWLIIRPEPINADEQLKVDSIQAPQPPHYQRTDDGEIIEVVDDEKPKRGGDATGE